MKHHRFLRSLLALLLSASLCSCASPSLFSIPLGTDSADAQVIVTAADSAETSAAAEETTAEDYMKDIPQNSAEILSEELSNRQEQLWDTEGTPAFYIPDYHSTRSMDVKAFEILDLIDDGKTVIYSYETAFYGDTSKYLGGASESGVAPENFWKTHKNWDVKEGADAGKAPKTNWEVYCLMRYRTDTREYQILDYHIGRISSSADTSDGAADALHQSYQLGHQRLFSGKLQDKTQRFGTTDIYYSLYDLNLTIVNSNMQIIKKIDLGSLAYTSIIDYFNRKFKWSERADWSTLQKKLAEGGMTYSVADVIMRDDAAVFLELNVSLNDLDGKKTDAGSKSIENTTGTEDIAEDSMYSLLCSFQMYSLGNGTDGIRFISKNLAYEQQVYYWQNNPDVSYEETLEEYPDRWEWASMEGQTDYKLCAVRLLNGEQIISNDTNWGYFSRLFQRYFESAQEGSSEEEKDTVWRNVFQELAGRSWTQSVIRTETENRSGSSGTSSSGKQKNTAADHYERVMKNIARPTEVTGGNVQYLIDQSKDNKNICVGIFDAKVAQSSTGIGMGSSIYRNTNTILEVDEPAMEATLRYTYSYVSRQRAREAYGETDDESDDEEDRYDGSEDDEDDDYGNYDSYSSDDMEAQEFAKDITITLKGSDAMMERFDIQEIENGRVLEKSASGEIFMYKDLSEGESLKSKIWYPDGTDENNGFVEINDRISSVKILEESKTEDGQKWFVAATGENAIWAFMASKYSGDEGSKQAEKYTVRLFASIPYTKAITPVTEIGSTTDIQYTDAAGVTRTANVQQKANLTGEHAIDLDGSTLRFTTLQSGIQLYDFAYGLTTVIDSGQYYAAWKQTDGTYTVIGFRGATTDAVYQDLMKAKIYQGLTITKEQKMLNTLKVRLKVDAEMRTRFLQRPDGWLMVCEEYGFEKENMKENLIEAYAKKVYAIYDAYDAALKKFWTCFLFQPTDAQKKEFEEKFQNFDSAVALESFIREKNEEYLKSVVTADVPEETTSGANSHHIVDDGWIYKVLQSQKEAKEKIEKEKKVKEALEEKEKENRSDDMTMESMVKAAQAMRDVWS